MRLLNRALLARQMLLERAKAPLARVLDRMGTLQVQDGGSCRSGSGHGRTAFSATS